MTLSYKQFNPCKVPLDNQAKKDAMFQCVTGFETIKHPHETDDLQGMLDLLQSNYIVYSNIIWKNNHRKKENAILKTDLLILDQDNTLSFQDLKELNLPFCYGILTTASCTKDKHKYRIFIPLEEEIEFKDQDEYKYMLEEVDAQLFNQTSDPSCFESGRGYISVKNSKAKIVNTSLISMKLINKFMKDSQDRLFATKIIKAMRPKTLINSKEDIHKNPFILRKLQDAQVSGQRFQATYAIMGLLIQEKGKTVQEAVDFILEQQIPGEYSNRDIMIARAQTISPIGSWGSVVDNAPKINNINWKKYGFKNKHKNKHKQDKHKQTQKQTQKQKQKQTQTQ